MPLPPFPLLPAQSPIYFKKALEESESEWSQHNAKSVIDTRAKGLRGSIPANFPYFNVDFGIGGGFVHVIDNEAEFDANIGKCPFFPRRRVRLCVCLYIAGVPLWAYGRRTHPRSRVWARRRPANQPRAALWCRT